MAGILIGPSVLYLVGSDEVLRVLGELGVILLLLEVGLQMDLTELGSVGRSSLLVATAGVAAPFALGYGVMAGFGEGGNTALFVGAALTATSVGVTARVFADLRALATTEARTVLGAAVADDVIGLVILTVVVRVVSEGSVSLLTVLGVVAVAVAFLGVGGVVGVRAAPMLFRFVHRRARSPGTLIVVALAFTLAFAEVADAAQLAPIVGAFVAGLSLARSDQAERIRRELTPLGHVFVPVFFLQIGIDARLERFAHTHVLLLAAALTAVAVAGKIFSLVGAAHSPGDKLLIGLGMIPRGEVGLIFATVGLHSGVLGQDLYGAVLFVVLATTMVTPSLLRWRLGRVRASSATVPAAGGPEPPGGWLRVDDGEVELAGVPPDPLALPLALRAARLAATRRPGPALLDWLGHMATRPLRWDPGATNELFRVLGEGNARSWRFLETTGVLERALPELARAMQRRRADPFELDPGHALRWSLLERLRELEGEDSVAASELAQLSHPERLLLAALILDAAGDPLTPPVEAARRLVQRLGLGADAEQEVALLVSDSALLRTAAARADGLEEEPVLQLATHLDRPEHARALYLLSLALGDLEPWDRQRLDELHTLVQAALAHPELSGREARNLAERRKTAALRSASPGPVAERIASAPRAYLLSQKPEDICRQAALLEPLPDRGRARVVVTLGDEPGHWRVEVALRDQPGLLAAVTAALHGCRLEVLEAIVATWPDGAALESFLVASPMVPSGGEIAAAVEESLRTPTGSRPVPDAEVTFDDGSPWYTICEVRVPDRPGLLHDLAAALAAAGADVHSARVTTVDGRAVDRFELTDRSGRHLDERTRQAIVAAIAEGVAPPRRRRFGPRRLATRPKHFGDRTETTVL